MKDSAKGTVFLRPLGLDDADSLAKNASDPEIRRNMGPLGDFPYPYTRSHAMGFIEASGNALIDGTMLNFAVCLSKTGELIGSCGIRNIDNARKECDIGYWIGRRYWGIGYGRDAVEQLIGMAFYAMGMKTVRARVLQSNSRSLRLLRSMGFAKAAEPEQRTGSSAATVLMTLSSTTYAKHSGITSIRASHG